MPPEERALLKAIIADPDDDTLRLAYADWLDENADALPKLRRATARTRAELIRNQIAQDELIFGTPDFEERYDALQERERELLDSPEVYKSMVAELEGITPARGLNFYYRRGLFGEVDCTVKYFVEYGAALFDAAPITTVQFKQLAASNVNGLANCPHFTRVRTVKIDLARTPAAAVVLFLHRKSIGHLRGLRFDSWVVDGTTSSWHERANPVALRVARCERLKGLKRLSFQAAGVGEAAGRVLALSPHLKNLAMLDLRDNPGLGTARAVLRRKFGKRVWFGSRDLKGLPLGAQDRD